MRSEVKIWLVDTAIYRKSLVSFCFNQHLLDAEGAALCEQEITDIFWIFILEGALMLLAGLAAGPRILFDYTVNNWKICTASGFVMSLAHALIIWALARSEVPLVSALREISVVIPGTVHCSLR